MATKIRLARHGKKGKPFYHIVIADSRSKRDGKYIERIGSYNPNINPALIDINFDRALYWIGVGAQPTDTVRAMLSYKGVLYKNHLLKGVKKGALTEAQVEKKFNAWLAEKENKIESKISNLEKAQEKAKEEFDKQLEKEGRTYVTSNSFGRAKRLDGTVKPSNTREVKMPTMKPTNVKSIYGNN